MVGQPFFVNSNSIEIIQKAYNNGINFYDTARFYTDSEEKLGASLNEVRENVIIATKTGAENAEDFWKDLETSLKNLQTDYVEIYQFHNLPFCPKPNDGSGLYEAMLEAKEEGMKCYDWFFCTKPLPKEEIGRKLGEKV